ncbi:hypothetical protein conserved [Leishmania donovani]|uniref:Uncharacterized protein n=3 Tax=Leishmania donovani species complex TaxID=38574 RepID=A0A381MKM4_LEIIN|nr:conserved hypothetical protein [Leishmania infantum JPCM5]TPP43934.1 hypothetical protein CGC20_1440 [Leishmania donovani]CAC9498576.1 hypothetical_protein_-_conserved [Leishmania infantum]TPP43936.1 hypothetical protein CGC20_1450 [Leishmania donovani]TPP46164.1 hypothetical protein CGC20_33240 [Leishmania donovani]CAC9498595.1 hypothetical_protein_-_conserved [Leishmania infantum]|eukprot:XP_001466291.1 conserved hypothetical protein [Leishmania infantum JPCM5]
MHDSVDGFWAACSGCGATSKRLLIHKTGVAASPIGLVTGEAVKHGSPLINVPYNSVFNGQTLRGDVLPRALPSLRKMLLFLTRRGRMGVVTAHSLWLACFVACYRQQCAVTNKAGRWLLQPLLSSTVYPPLPNLFSERNKFACPSLRASSAAELEVMERRVQDELDLTYSMLRHYIKRRGVSSKLRPSRDMLVQAHRTVMQRALLLPRNGEPSAPAELSELIETSPDLPLFPSLVPAIDLIRAAPLHSRAEAEEDAEPPSSGNCSIFTCVQSDFLSSSSRRRVIVETAPLAARRVVVCATKPLKEGTELLMEFE